MNEHKDPRQLAFDLASKGFEVVPLNREGSFDAKGRTLNPKAPAWRDWQNKGISDPLDVLDNWPGAEFWPGILTGKKCVVLDVDVSKGKDGLEQLAKLQAELGAFPDTYTVRTASGGLHLYFETPVGETFANSKLRDVAGNVIVSMDVRAHGGQVVAPGVALSTGEYKVERDVPMALLPPPLIERLRTAPARRQAGDVQADDMPGARLQAEAWLKDRAPEVVEGNRDNTGFQVAAKLYNFGCSWQTIRDLVGDWYTANAAGEDDIGPDDFDRWTNSAFRSSQGEFGRDNVSKVFSAVPDFQAEEKKNAFAGRIRPYRATEEFDAAIPLRPWLVHGVAIRSAVSVVAAPGGMGKSLWAIQLAFALALGGDVAPRLIGTPVAETTNVLVVNNEDPDDELDRRLAAVALHFGLPRGAAVDRVHLMSGAKQKFKFAVRNRASANGVAAGDELEYVKTYVREHNIGCVVFDPLATLHEMNETDNSEMQRVMELITSFAADLNVAVVVLHHTPKPPIASADSYAGTVNAIRGATAIKDAARIALTLFGMSEKDAERFDKPAAVRHRYVRLDDAKQNLVLASPEAKWFRKESVRLANGETLGVLVPEELKPNDGERARAMLSDVADAVAEEPKSVAKVVEELQELVQWKSTPAGRLRKLLLEAFANDVATSGEVQIQLDRKGATGGYFSIVA